MPTQSSLSNRFKRSNQSIQSRSNHSVFNGHHATVDCPDCHRIMVPRVITYYGQPTKSICPFCGATFARFPSGIKRFLTRGVAIFAKRFFRASQQEKIGKNYATTYACGAPIRPRHLVPTQQGVET
ncbi:hypothetical protein [Methylomonas albis]|uniref:Uncharacterized protein n=1 Tax=Methylomonas albis TaxID=1854563 RepID=A0ABR9D1X7_9GAMM|nr:hypothetical protein [Methylomonas albis]MBD9356229.1 hypothetical protein [Methylomonas albis]